MSESTTSAAGPDPRIGAVVADKYTIVRLLGRGGMGSVYQARHATLSRRFAIKFMQPEYALRADALVRFENEAKLAGSLEHPNLAAVVDHGRFDDGAPYLVMEYLEGEDCGRLLRRLGPLPLARAVDIVAQACRGLRVAHRAGVVHRDLKPENLFLTDAGDGRDLVKVLDFGIAKLRSPDSTSVTGSGNIMGTCYYMSPEQTRGAADVDERADVWSMGVVLYELLSGRKPFPGDNVADVIAQILSVDPPPVTTLRPEVPPYLGQVIARALCKPLEGRLPSIRVFAQELEPFAQPGRQAAAGVPPALQPTVTAPDKRPPGPAPRRSGRLGWLALLAVALVAIGVVVARKLISKRAAPTAPARVVPKPPVNPEPPPPSPPTPVPPTPAQDQEVTPAPAEQPRPPHNPRKPRPRKPPEPERTEPPPGLKPDWSNPF